MVVGIPKIHYFGVEGDFNILVMEILGPNLEDLFKYCDKKFSLKTISMIAIELVERIEYIHRKGFIHRDIKPENFLIGGGKK